MSGLLNNEETMQDELLTEEEQRFTVKDDQSADWAAWKVAEIEADTARWVAHYEEQLAKIRKNNEFRAEYFKRMLKDYFYTVPHKMSKTQSSYQLPRCKLIMKAQGPEFEREEGTLLDWLDKQPDYKQFVKVKETVNWAGLKKALEGEEGIAILNSQVVTPDGEVVPGITVKERPNIFKVEVR
jgi:hypothetical protein